MFLFLQAEFNTQTAVHYVKLCGAISSVWTPFMSWADPDSAVPSVAEDRNCGLSPCMWSSHPFMFLSMQPPKLVRLSFSPRVWFKVVCHRNFHQCRYSLCCPFLFSCFLPCFCSTWLVESLQGLTYADEKHWEDKVLSAILTHLC